MTTLSTELTTDPLARGYAALIPSSPGVLVEMLNELSYTAPQQTYVTARMILAAHGAAGASVLDKLDAAGANVPAVKWAMKFMLTDGIDVNHPNTRGLLAQLVGGGVLTQADSDSLTTMAVQPASRATVLGLSPVTEADIRSALGL